MNNKIYLAVLVIGVAMLFSALLYNPAPAEAIGYKENISVPKGEHQIVKERTIVGYKPQYDYIDVPEKCYMNGTCVEAHKERRLNKNEKVPIYDYEEIGIEADGKFVSFEGRGCYVCGDKLLCFDKSDGWSENRNPAYKCICRSGETCEEVPL